MTSYDSYQEWPRTTLGRAMVAGLGAGALGGAVMGFLSLLGDEGFYLTGALLIGGLFGCLFGVIAGGLTGAVAGGVASLLARAGPLPARVALALSCGALIAVTAWFTWDPEGRPGQIVVSVVVGATAAGIAWALGPWCLTPTSQGPGSRDR